MSYNKHPSPSKIHFIGRCSLCDNISEVIENDDDPSEVICTTCNGFIEEALEDFEFWDTLAEEDEEELKDV